MTKINARIVGDSVSPQGHRITSYICTYPRFIHAEVMTHRLFSRNAASSRAIPYGKMVQSIKDDPFIPIAWQKGHKGMQGNDYLTNPLAIQHARNIWLLGAAEAINMSRNLSILAGLDDTYEIGSYPNSMDKVFTDFEDDEYISITKQLCNRPLEPFMWYTCLITATEYDNFFELRCPKYELSDGEIAYSKRDAIRFSNGNEDPIFYNKVKDYNDIDWLKESKSGAEIHIQALAEAMWDARNESNPNKLKAGEWHVPFGDNMEYSKINEYIVSQGHSGLTQSKHEALHNEIKLKVAVARCARLSYMTFDGDIDYAKDIALHDQLLASKHMSPTEHVALCTNDSNWYGNFKGWNQYRKILES